MYLAVFVIAFLLLIWFFVDINRDQGILTNLRLSFIKSLVIMGILVVGITEIASVFNAVTRPVFFISWLSICVVLAIRLFGRYRSVVNYIKTHRRYVTVNGNRTRRVLTILTIGFILLPLLILALYMPPNNHDSMTYHLPRIEHWIQNQNVDYYPVTNLRQLALAPFSEYVILQIRILAGNDWFVNLVQYIAMLACLVLAGMIVRHFGGGATGQLLAAFLVVTLPMGILQSTTTQTDYLAAFAVMGFVYFGIGAAYPGPERTISADLLFSALCLGLAMLTKATAVPFALPFVIWFSGRFIRVHRKQIVRIVSIGLIYLTALIVINAPFYWRNIKIFHSPLGPEAIRRTTNEALTLSNTLSNIIRNIEMHLILPTVYARPLNRRLHQGVDSFTAILGLERHPDAATFGPTRFPDHRAHEDYSGNPVHFALLMVSLILLVLRPPPRIKSGIVPYAASILVLPVLYSLFLKWQTWGSRLQLPFFILAVPVIAGVLAGRVNKPPGLKAALLLIMIGLSLFYVLENERKPLLRKPHIFLNSRSQNYFVNKPELHTTVRRMAALLRTHGVKHVGLDLKTSQWEYPFWRFFTNAIPDLEMRHMVFPENLLQTRNFRKEFAVTAVITHRRINSQWRHRVHSVFYLKPFNLIILKSPRKFPLARLIDTFRAQ